MEFDLNKIDPKYHTLFECLLEIEFWIDRRGFEYAINLLLNQGHIGNLDWYGWELARWSERFLAFDIHGYSFKNYHIQNVDHLYYAWLDPNFFEETTYWGFYSEDEVRQALKIISRHWIDQYPKEKKNYELILKQYGLWD